MAKESKIGLARLRTGKSRLQGDALVLESRTYEADRNKIARISYEKMKKDVAHLGAADWSKANPRNMTVRDGH
jgi:hypothetical protein